MKVIPLLICLPLLCAVVITIGGCRTGDTALADTTPPTITDISVTDITETTATITWTTDEPATSVVLHTADYVHGRLPFVVVGCLSIDEEKDLNLVTAHRIVVEARQPATELTCRLVSTDASGNESESVPLTITTLGMH